MFLCLQHEIIKVPDGQVWLIEQCNLNIMSVYKICIAQEVRTLSPVQGLRVWCALNS